MKSKGSAQRIVTHINNYYPETIELIVALILFAWGLVTLVPIELMPGSIYEYNIAKIPFGILLATPGAYLIVLRLRHKVAMYQSMVTKRRQCLFFISTALIYLAVLSAINSPWPPRFLLFLAQALIAILCYLRLIRK